VKDKLAALQKTFECLTCKAPIKLERDRVNNKWIRYNLDGTLHIDQKKKQQPQQQQLADTTVGYSRGERAAELEISREDKLTKEIAAIKTQLLELVSRLDRIEQQEMPY
jgi:hypothetical protein